MRQFAPKFAALIIALTLNGVIAAGVATLFNLQIQSRSAESQIHASSAIHAVA